VASWGVEPVVARLDDDGLIASHKNLIVSVHWHAPSLALAEALERHTAEVVAEHGRFASIVLVTGDRRLSAPEGLARSKLQALVSDTKETGLGTAIVVTRAGFVAGTVVALLSGLFTLARTREPNKAFRALAPAAQWLEPHLRASATPWRDGEVLTVAENTAALALAAM